MPSTSTILPHRNGTIETCAGATPLKAKPRLPGQGFCSHGSQSRSSSRIGTISVSCTSNQMVPKKRSRARGQRKRVAGGKMSKAYRALLRERPELAAISDAEISAAAAAIDMVDRMTAGLSYFELLE